MTKPRTCPHCEGMRLWWDGRRLRTASVLIDDRVVHLVDVACRRIKCADCRKSWTLRPAGLVPHKHYQLDVVARATSRYVLGGASLETVATQHGCARRTVRRWLDWLIALVPLQALLQRVLEACEEPVLVRAQAATKPLGLAQRVADTLGLFELWAAAEGLEPPGLRAVLERLVADRSAVATYGHPLLPEFARRP